MDQSTLEHDRAQRHLDLLRAVAGLGTSLDAVRTAEDLATLLVAGFDFADVAMVDVAQAVLEGDVLPAAARFGNLVMRRLGAAQRGGGWQSGLPGAGADTPTVPVSPMLHELQQGRPVLINDLGLLRASLGGHSGLIRSVLPEQAESGLSVALYARGLLLGAVTVWRSGPSAPFDGDDAALIEQIACLAALTFDNARRAVREKRAAVELQSSLLPPALFEDTAAETVGMYVPAGTSAGVGGDWFDVVSLPSARTAFVIGDVVGHGIYAAATMGRLRTAVQTLADMELEPDELLARLDDLVTRRAMQRREESAPRGEALGTTCLYAVYDPGERRCTFASAGHPPPVVVTPEGTAQFVDVVPGPPLGIGGMPFEPYEVDIEPGSVLVFYSDGLVGFPSGDMEAGMERLRRVLHTEAGVDRDLEGMSHRVMAQLVTTPCTDDATALFVRTRAVSSQDMAVWELPADPSIVAEVREQVSRQLAAWELDEMTFTTELVVSELVTNAIRYAGGPVGLRLIRDRALVCEVSDPSNTHPRLRRAHDMDEGGRGLFLVAQLTDRWGSRYTRSGKTIWTEQLLVPSS
ncbi:ATP-binding SpoIIE family protein phosphatase [Streptomyces spiralis]|uniref:ATP-binding SpoIIE family protein phosphatase n=1 Tax=Streptomyces spiralis TaxID=66376 RepID=UPI0033FB9196